MKWKVNNIGRTVIWSVLVVALMVSLSFAGMQQSRVVCEEVNISISPDTLEGFVDKNEVIEIVSNGKGLSSILNMPFDTDSVPAMESRLRQNPFLKNADVYFSVSGELNIRVKQRKPLVRVVRYEGDGYYIDEDGMKMPLSNKYTARVMVATGNLYEKFSADSVKSYVARELYTLARYVDKNPFWNAQIEQIFVNQSSELLLIPKVGSHVIVFGSTDDMEDKFRRLMVFYRKAMPVAGWNIYKTINLKFKDQVVCEKQN